MTLLIVSKEKNNKKPAKRWQTHLDRMAKGKKEFQLVMRHWFCKCNCSKLSKYWWEKNFNNKVCRENHSSKSTSRTGNKVRKRKTEKTEIPLPPALMPPGTKKWIRPFSKPKERKNEEMEPKQKQHPVVDVTGDGSKVQCCKEQYCIRTWNVRSMNQGKSEVVKQEMARVNIDILGISELKWTGMGLLRWLLYLLLWARSLGRNGVAIIVNKSPKCSAWMKSQKQQNDLCFQGKPFTITVIQVYTSTSNAEAEVEWFYENLQDLLELTPKKDVLFIIGDWNTKVGSQEIPGVTGKFGLGVQNEGNRMEDRNREKQ